MNTITILLVDDHTVVRHGLRAFLNTQPDFNVVGEAEDGLEALPLVEELVPDVVLMDLVMEGMNGVSATRKIKTISPRSQVVVLTSYHSDEFIFPALQAGAISYILKNSDMDDVAEAIRLAADGQAKLDPEIAMHVIQEMRGESGSDVNPFVELTDREFDVLRLIASGMRNHEIAEELVIAESTVKGYVSNILSKLHLNDRTQAAVYAWRKGIMRESDN